MDSCVNTDFYLAVAAITLALERNKENPTAAEVTRYLRFIKTKYTSFDLIFESGPSETIINEESTRNEIDEKTLAEMLDVLKKPQYTAAIIPRCQLKGLRFFQIDPDAEDMLFSESSRPDKLVWMFELVKIKVERREKKEKELAELEKRKQKEFAESEERRRKELREYEKEQERQALCRIAEREAEARAKKNKKWWRFW